MDLVFEYIGDGKPGCGFDDGADPKDLIIHENSAVYSRHFNTRDLGIFEKADDGRVASGF